MIDVFQEVRDRVTALDAARHYGLEVNRAGFCCCPFHHEKTASMKLYPGAKGFYCFGCHAGGSVIDFTAQLLGLDALGAVRRLNADFSLNLQLDQQPTQAEQQEVRRRQEIAAAHKAFEEWRGGFIRQLNAAYRVAHIALKRGGELTEREAAAVRMQAPLEYYADTLANGTPEEQAQIYRERGQIARWIEPILND